MNSKLIKKTKLNKDDYARINEVSRELKLHNKLIEVLFSRGLSDSKSISNFLYPSIDNLHDPFLLKGMSEAVVRIKGAIAQRERIVIYGDYDADGICAASILFLFLSSIGADVATHIPSRSGEGYGLNVDSIEQIIEEFNPDLILTCDCGISAHVEVEHAQDLGVDVIVSDHHEVSSIIPQCIVINPKQSDCGYPYNYLCGAGVALKIVQAIGGVDALIKYSDLASIATIADLVPLLDENRLIVQLGLRELNKRSNIGIRSLLERLELKANVTSGDIAYKLAPRINAAGRMGDAYRAFELLTTSDKEAAANIVADIDSDNMRRKEVCDNLFNEAIEDVKFEDLVSNRSVILSHPSWEKGITGIVAARLTNIFRRPSMILVSNGDNYKGTSRSIDGINMYEVLTEMSDLLIEFGGHSQAAGFSILKENIAPFKERVNEYLKRYSSDIFLPSVSFDTEINESEINMALVKSLELLEPTGNSNQKPLFMMTTKDMKMNLCKNAVHTSIVTTSGLQILAYNNYSDNQYLVGSGEKNLVLELQLNEFLGRESVKAVLKGISCDRVISNERTLAAGYLYSFSTVENSKPVFTSIEALDEVEVSGIFGTLVIAYSERSFDEFNKLNKENIVLREFGKFTTMNNYSRVILCPDISEISLSNYERVYFLDSPIDDGVISYVNKHSKAEVYLRRTSGLAFAVTTDRAEFVKYYDTVKRNGELIGEDIFNYFDKVSARTANLDINQFIFCYLVFRELGIFVTGGESFSVRVNTKIKSELSNSSIFNKIGQRS